MIQKTERLKKVIDSSDSIIFFTGAGISTDENILSQLNTEEGSLIE